MLEGTQTAIHCKQQRGKVSPELLGTAQGMVGCETSKNSMFKKFSRKKDGFVCPQ